MFSATPIFYPLARPPRVGVMDQPITPHVDLDHPKLCCVPINSVVSGKKWRGEDIKQCHTFILIDHSRELPQITPKNMQFFEVLKRSECLDLRCITLVHRTVQRETKSDHEN